MLPSASGWHDALKQQKMPHSSLETRPARAGAQPIVIIGAGIVGTACALALARMGRETVLIDQKSPAAETSAGNAGILARIATIPVPTPGIIRKIPRLLFSAEQPFFLRWGYLPALFPWVLNYVGNSNLARVRKISDGLAPLTFDAVAQHRRLAANTEAAKFIRQSPYVYLYPDRERFKSEAALWRIRKNQGFEWEEISAQSLRKQERFLSEHYRFAVRMPDHGYIANPESYVCALAKAYCAAGGEIRVARITDIVPQAQGVVLADENGTQIRAKQALIAMGAWSHRFARRFGVRLRTESERGYHVEFLNAKNTARTPLMDAARKFAATPMQTGMRCAGIVEFGGLRAPASEKALAWLEASARKMFPQMEYSGIKKWMGHRPAPADSLPIMGRAPAHRDVFFAYGHHHIGMTAGAKSGQLMAQLLTGAEPDIDMSPYSPER